MQHFDEQHEGMRVVDSRGESLGKIAGVEEGEARLQPETGVQSRMEAAADAGTDGLTVRPEQVVDVTDDEVRVTLGDEE